MLAANRKQRILTKLAQGAAPVPAPAPKAKKTWRWPELKFLPQSRITPQLGDSHGNYSVQRSRRKLAKPATLKDPAASGSSTMWYDSSGKPTWVRANLDPLKTRLTKRVGDQQTRRHSPHKTYREYKVETDPAKFKGDKGMGSYKAPADYTDPAGKTTGQFRQKRAPVQYQYIPPRPGRNEADLINRVQATYTGAKLQPPKKVPSPKSFPSSYPLAGGTGRGAGAALKGKSLQGPYPTTVPKPPKMNFFK
jgi:hypothetical protein